MRLRHEDRISVAMRYATLIGGFIIGYVMGAA